MGFLHSRELLAQMLYEDNFRRIANPPGTLLPQSSRS
jgi:hypothetical protein